MTKKESEKMLSQRNIGALLPPQRAGLSSESSFSSLESDNENVVFTWRMTVSTVDEDCVRQGINQKKKLSQRNVGALLPPQRAGLSSKALFHR
jgi:hypothetical protein